MTLILTTLDTVMLIVTIMNVANKAIMLNDIILSAIMLNIIMLANDKHTNSLNHKPKSNLHSHLYIFDLAEIAS
jgi:hypothetical protein